MTEYFPEEKEDEEATFMVSSFKILATRRGGREEGGGVQQRYQTPRGILSTTNSLSQQQPRAVSNATVRLWKK